MTAKNTTNFAHSALFIYVHCEQFCCCYYYYYHHHHHHHQSTLCRVFTVRYPKKKKKMLLRYTELQLFCSDSLWYM